MTRHDRHGRHSPSSRDSTSASALDGTTAACGTWTSTTARCGPPDVSGDDRVEVEVPGEPAGLGWLPDGRLLVVARKPRTVLRMEADGRLVEHGDLNPTGRASTATTWWSTRCGRAYVGNFGFDLDGSSRNGVRRHWSSRRAHRPRP